MSEEIIKSANDLAKNILATDTHIALHVKSSSVCTNGEFSNEERMEYISAECVEPFTEGQFKSLSPFAEYEFTVGNNSITLSGSDVGMSIHSEVVVTVTK